MFCVGLFAYNTGQEPKWAARAQAQTQAQAQHKHEQSKSTHLQRVSMVVWLSRVHKFTYKRSAVVRHWP